MSLGKVVVEARGFDEEGGEAAGYRNVMRYRPQGVRLDNDGVSYWWIEPGIRYTLEHDGIGWHVTMDVGSASAHYYRMAALEGERGTAFVDWLPGADGLDMILDPARRYLLELVEPTRELVLSEL